MRLAIVVSTKLIALGRVYRPQANPFAVDLDCVAVDHAGAPRDLFSVCRFDSK